MPGSKLALPQAGHSHALALQWPWPIHPSATCPCLECVSLAPPQTECEVVGPCPCCSCCTAPARGDSRASVMTHDNFGQQSPSPLQSPSPMQSPSPLHALGVHRCPIVVQCQGADAATAGAFAINARVWALKIVGLLACPLACGIEALQGNL